MENWLDSDFTYSWMIVGGDPHGPPPRFHRGSLLGFSSGYLPIKTPLDALRGMDGERMNKKYMDCFSPIHAPLTFYYFVLVKRHKSEANRKKPLWVVDDYANCFCFMRKFAVRCLDTPLDGSKVFRDIVPRCLSSVVEYLEGRADGCAALDAMQSALNERGGMEALSGVDRHVFMALSRFSCDCPVILAKTLSESAALCGIPELSLGWQNVWLTRLIKSEFYI